MICHSVAVTRTLVKTKYLGINIHKRNNTKKQSTNKTKHSKYKYTYYQKTQTLQNPHLHSPIHYKTSQNNHSTRYTPNEIVTIQSSTLSIRSPEYTWYFCPQELHRNSLHFTSLHFKTESLHITLFLCPSHHHSLPS